MGLEQLYDIGIKPKLRSLLQKLFRGQSSAYQIYYLTQEQYEEHDFHRHFARMFTAELDQILKAYKVWYYVNLYKEQLVSKNFQVILEMTQGYIAEEWEKQILSGKINKVVL